MFIFFQGFALGAALILPIGPQNTLVLRQGIQRRYAFIAATFCVLSDILLISAGGMGVATFIGHYPLLKIALSGFGVLFLLWYCYGLIKELKQSRGPETEAAQPPSTSLTRLLCTLFAVTWLNPHVYLDTLVVLGGLGSQIPADQRMCFITGAICASVIGFYTLSTVSVLLSAKLRQPKIQTIISLIVIVLLLILAINLTRESLVLLHQWGEAGRVG